MSDCFTLILETSTPHASLASVEPEGRMNHRDFTSDRSHNSALFAPLQELLDLQDTQKIGLVIVGSGPGSYSGTRVGIAAAQGVAIAAACPAVAIPSILAVPSAMNGAPCLAIGDARRGAYWTARVEHCKASADPELTDAQGLASLVQDAITEGISIFSFEDPSRFPLTPDCREQIKQEFPNAERLWQAWNASPPENQQRWLSECPQPIYLKPPHITPSKRSWLVTPPNAQT